MAELALGLVGAAATAGAAVLTTGSGFVGRHESSHREEMMDTRRSMADFKENLESGDVTHQEHTAFLNTRDEAIQRQNEYYQSIESYKEASWVNPLNKLKKKKEVRKAKRWTRQSNHSLRTLNEVRRPVLHRPNTLVNKFGVDLFGIRYILYFRGVGISAWIQPSRRRSARLEECRRRGHWY
ncbi:hypothetical protein C8R44DRAFT_248765 [Mycena epipterygia]|nr:hypothetical protein C8R44DRAFT_248765 [Mycena epipterygia]